MDSLTPYLQTYSVLAIALAAGTNLSTTIVSLPALLHASPTTLAKQWKILFNSGVAPMASLSTSAGIGFATLAYQAHIAPALASTGVASYTKRNLYVAAAVTAFGLGPYTKLLMWDNITALEALAKAATEGTVKGDTHALVRTWGTYNFFRGTMLLVSAGLGAWASVN